MFTMFTHALGRCLTLEAHGELSSAFASFFEPFDNPFDSSLPRGRFLDVTQRSPKRTLRDIQKTAARETSLIVDIRELKQRRRQHFTTIPCERSTAKRHMENQIFGEIRPCTDNIARFERFRTFRDFPCHRNPIGRSGVQVEKEREKFTVVCSRSTQNLEFGHFYVVAENGTGNEMHQNLKRTCSAERYFSN